MTNTSSANALALPNLQPALDPALFPNLYGMGVSGDCMAPMYPDGCQIKVSKLETFARGDVVALWFKPDLIRPGGARAMIKRIAMMPPPWVKGFPYRDHPDSEVQALVMLSANDKPDALLQVRCSDIIAIHKVVGLLKKRETYTPSEEELGSLRSKRAPARSRSAAR